MIETILILPIIFVIIALMFFFGSAMVRFQHSTQMDRYEAWRIARHAPGPGVQEMGNTILLDRTFFATDPSGTLRADRVGSWPQASHWYEMVEQILQYNPAHGQFFEEVFEEMPRNIVAQFTTGHPTNNAIANFLNQEVTHRHVVTGNAWWYAHPHTGQERQHYLHLLREHYFEDFDRRLAPLANSGNRWAQIIRDFYMHRPPYRGPDLPNWATQ